MRVLVIFTVLLTAAFVSGQEKPPADLVNEFGKITCEDFLARSDYFVHRLNQSPNAEGLVALEANAQYFSKLLQTTLNARLNKLTRVTILQIDTSGVGNRFWLLPAGADPPNITGGRVVASFPQSYAQRTFFSHEGEGPCTFSTAGAFATVLKSKDGLEGRVVIHGPANERADAIDWVIRGLTIDSRLPRNRFRVFYKTEQVPFTEYWLVPKSPR